MTLKVLGNLTAFLINSEMLLDAGSVVDSVDLECVNRVRHILLTHCHIDHIRDLPILLEYRLTNHQIRPLTVYSNRFTIQMLREHIFNDLIWPDFTHIPSESTPLLRFVELKTGLQERISQWTVQPVEMEHSVPTSGYIIGREGTDHLAFTADTGPTDEFWTEVKNRDVRHIIVEVSFPEQMRQVAIRSGHLTPGLLGEALQRHKIRPGMLYITHMKPLFSKVIEGELGSFLSVPFRLLKKGDVIEI